MRIALLVALGLVGCAQPHKPCFTTLELGVQGSRSEGDNIAPGIRWDNDDTTIGGSATMTFDFTGACEE